MVNATYPAGKTSASLNKRQLRSIQDKQGGTRYAKTDRGRSDGRIRAAYCSELFAFYSSVEEINFNGVLDTSQATEMFRMFQGCSSLTDPDLSSFDFSHVQYYGEFMDEGMTANGVRWEKLFR